MFHATFEVGERERHRVDVYFSTWGLEIYQVDGIEVLRIRSWSVSGERSFLVGETEYHKVAIVVDLLSSWKAWILPGQWQAQVYVNGKLFLDDLNPEWRRTAKIVTIWFILISVALVAFLIYWLNVIVA